MTIKKLNKNFLINLFVIVTIFSLDRISKLYVIFLYKKNFNSEIFTSKFLNIYLIWNEGIAFGLFSFQNENLYNILSAIIFLVILYILFLFKDTVGLKKYALLMILGGAIGNIYDRIVYNAVPDFIDFHIGNFHWFIFNVSDIFITFGVILLINFELLKSEKKDR
mgnify:FL=1